MDIEFDTKENENPTTVFPCVPSASGTQASDVLRNFLVQAVGVSDSTVDELMLWDETECVSVLDSTRKQWRNFKVEDDYYNKHSLWKRNISTIKIYRDEIQNSFSELNDFFKQLASNIINRDSGSKSYQLSKMYQRRHETITNIIIKCGRLNVLLKLATDKLVVRNHQIRRRANKSENEDELYHASLKNICHWDIATEKLILNPETTGDILSMEELLYCAQSIKSAAGIHVKHLLSNLLHNTNTITVRKCAHDLMTHLPVLILRKGDSYVAIDVHNFLYQTNIFDLINDSGVSEWSESTKEPWVEKESPTHTNHSPNSPGQTAEKKTDKPRRGRKTIVSKHPDLVQKALCFIKEHSYSAHERRREKTASCGVSLVQIRDHLLENVDGLESISVDTVHRLMEPPRKGSIAAKNYKCLINARVPHKQNNITKDHEDIHYCRATVKYFAECFSENSEECTFISCDDMNKINVGTPAVSRYHQINKFFVTSDIPDLSDHDFPEPNSKLNASGYLLLQPKIEKNNIRSQSVPYHAMNEKSIHNRRCRSLSPNRSSEKQIHGKFIRDKNHRLHFTTPKSGPQYIYVRPVRYHSSTSVNHANDLHSILKKQNKKIVGIISDGGPDWSIKSIHNVFIYGRLWKDLKLDYFSIIQHAPGNSKENPIEHSWAPRSRDLTSVVLPRRIDVSTNITSDELDKLSFNNAVERCCAYWENKTFDNFPVFPIPVLSADIPKPYDDFENLKTYFSKIKITDHELKTEMHELLKHCVRRVHGIEFIKCADSLCEHCTTNPPEPSKFLNKLKLFGGHLPFPMEDIMSPGHYSSYIQVSMLAEMGKPLPHNDRACPSVSKSFDQCSYGCNYVYLSQADKDRHIKICHYLQDRQVKRMAQQEVRRNAKKAKV